MYRDEPSVSSGGFTQSCFREKAAPVDYRTTACQKAIERVFSHTQTHTRTRSLSLIRYDLINEKILQPRGPRNTAASFYWLDDAACASASLLHPVRGRSRAPDGGRYRPASKRFHLGGVPPRRENPIPKGFGKTQRRITQRVIKKPKTGCPGFFGHTGAEKKFPLQPGLPALG